VLRDGTSNSKIKLGWFCGSMVQLVSLHYSQKASDRDEKIKVFVCFCFEDYKQKWSILLLF